MIELGLNRRDALELHVEFPADIATQIFNGGEPAGNVGSSTAGARIASTVANGLDGSPSPPDGHTAVTIL